MAADKPGGPSQENLHTSGRLIETPNDARASCKQPEL